MRNRRGEWRIAVIGVGISTLIAFALAFIVSDSILLGFAIGLTGTTLALQLETIVRFQPQNDLEEATKAAPSPQRRNKIQADAVGIARFASVAAALDKPVITNELDALFAEALQRAEDMSLGHIRKAKFDPELLLDHARRTSKVLRATTDERDVEFWLDEHRGGRFFKANRELIGRDVRIERVFIFGIESMPEKMAALERIMADHAALGVQCFRVDAASVRADLLVNMTMFDEEAVHWDVTDTTGHTIYQIHSIRREDIERHLGIFEELKRRATGSIPQQVR